MTLSKDDKSYIDEAIAQQLDIMSAFRDLPESAREELANDIGPYIYSRLQSQEKPKNFYTPRWTVDMADINEDDAGVEQGHAGPTLPRWVDIIGGTAHLDGDDPQILHFRAGGGADCMFTRLVSACWADEVAAGRGVEGQSMTSLTGCTFNVYSTPFGASGAITAMNTAAATAAGLGAAADEVLFICSGTYVQTATQVVTPNTYSSFRIVGAHQQATTLQTDAGSIIQFSIGAIQQGAIVTIEELCFDTTTNSDTLVTAIDFGSSAQATIHNCTFSIGSLNVGIKPGSSAAECRIFDNVFTGGGAGVGTDTVGNHLTVMGNSFLSMDRGVVMSNNAQHTIVDNLFEGCTTGIEFSGNSSSTDAIIANNRFNTCTKGINALTGTNIQYNTSIVGNNFVIESGEVGIDFSSMNASGLITTWQIGPNTFRSTHSTAKGIIGDASFTINQITNNTFRNFTSGNEISGLAATTVAAHNVSDAGAIADNGSPVGHAGTGSGGAASNAGKFITYATDATLTDNRILVAGSGIDATDAGTNDGNFTLDLAALTANWVQSGAFGIWTAGSGRVGSSSAPTNVTAGDFTATRLFIPDATLLTGLISQFGGPIGLSLAGAFRYYDLDNSHYTAFKAHDTTTATVTYTWPPADGTSGYQLTTDGAGVLTWAAAGSGGGGSVATDTIWNAVGDIAHGTGADTAAVLTVGANDTILMADSGVAGVGLKWVASASPSAVGTAAATGTGDTFTRGDHVHAHEAAHINHDTTWSAANELIKASGNDAAAVLSPPTNHHFLGGTGVTYQAAIEAGVYASRPAASTANIGRLYRATDRANTLYQCSDATTWVVVNPRIYTMGWYIDGRLRADASNKQGPIRYLPDLDGITTETVALWKPVRCKVHLGTTSAGASVIVQIEFGTTATPGTDLFASGDRPTIAAASVESTSVTFADSAIENGSAFELIIDQVGSTSGSEGTDLSVELEFVQIDA